MKIKKKLMAAIVLAGLLALVPGRQVKADDDGSSAAASSAEDTEELSLPDRIAEAVKAGRRNVDIVTGNVMEVPSSVLRNLSGKKVTLALHTGDGLAVSLTGTEIKKADQPFRIVIREDEVLPEAMRQEVLTGALASREFAMTEQAHYPFCVNVHLDLGSENAGRPAILYYYDETAEKMRPVGIFKVSESGYAMFALNRGDEYIAVVVDGNAYTVTQGDTLGKIAGKSRVKLGKLLAENPFISNPDRIYPGQVIVLP